MILVFFAASTVARVAAKLLHGVRTSVDPMHRWKRMPMAIVQTCICSKMLRLSNTYTPCKVTSFWAF